MIDFILGCIGYFLILFWGLYIFLNYRRELLFVKFLLYGLDFVVFLKGIVVFGVFYRIGF